MMMPNDSPTGAPKPPAKPPEIVATLADQKLGPDRVATLANEAAGRGIPFSLEHAESNGQRKIREWSEDSSVPTISASDNRAFLQNLQKIAAGDLRVI